MSTKAKIIIAGSHSRKKSECIDLLCADLLSCGIKASVFACRGGDSVFEQIESEDDFIEKNSESDVIFFDGCAADCSDDEIKKYGLARLWSRYDCVILTDFSDDAQASQKYVGHPHLRCAFAATAADAASAAAAEVRCVLSDTETELKFLIERPSAEVLRQLGAVGVDIEQTYLLSSAGSHRIRKRGTDGDYAYYETLKKRISGTKCYEYENIISKSEYDALMLNADPAKHTIKKVRYCFLFDKKYFELDVFDFWSDRALLEIELKTADESFSLPPELNVKADVSSDPHYKNNYLAGLNL